MPRSLTSASVVVHTIALQVLCFDCSSEEKSHEVVLHRAGKMLCDAGTHHALDDDDAGKRLHGNCSLPFEH